MWRTFGTVAVSTIALLSVIEIVLGYVAYQKRADFRGPATQLFIERGAREIDLFMASRATTDRRDIAGLYSFDADVLVNPISPEAREFRRHILASYRTELAALQDVAGVTPVIPLYLPARSLDERFFQGLYREIFSQAGLKIVDMTDEFARHEALELYLDPYNGHLSRFANIQIAKQLSKSLGSLQPTSTGQLECDDTPGPFRPLTSDTWKILEIAPYEVRTDALGFRATTAEPYVPGNPNLLILGDSFTFGPYLPNEDTYPAILSRLLGGTWNVVNGAVAGYTIRDERHVLERLSECASFGAIVLQVLANDFSELAALNYNEFNYLGEVIAPSAAETAFYETLTSPEVRLSHGAVEDESSE